MQKFEIALNEEFQDQTPQEMVFVLREQFDGVTFVIDDITVEEETEEGVVIDVSHTVLYIPEEFGTDPDAPDLREAISMVVQTIVQDAMGDLTNVEQAGTTEISEETE